VSSHNPVHELQAVILPSWLGFYSDMHIQLLKIKKKLLDLLLRGV